MSQHPSLAKDPFSKKFRSVMKRFERIKFLKEKDKWQDGDSVTGLPKIKAIKFKAKKKTKDEAKEGEKEEKKA